jgi:hypothetical protein
LHARRIARTQKWQLDATLDFIVSFSTFSCSWCSTSEPPISIFPVDDSSERQGAFIAGCQQGRRTALAAPITGSLFIEEEGYCQDVERQSCVVIAAEARFIT